MIGKYRKTLLISIMYMSIFLSIISNAIGIDPNVGAITLTPTNPAPLSVVTFTVDINGDNILSVKIIVFECNKELGVCHAPPQNVTMKKIEDNTYEAEVKLKHDDVTSITYHIEIESDSKWIEYDEYTKALSIESDSNGSNSNESPGFETITFLIAIITFLLLFKRFKLK